MIDLTTCVPGQKLRLRNGETATYLGISNLPDWPHRVKSDKYTALIMNHKLNGRWLDDNHDEPEDVVEILPLEGAFSAKISPDHVETSGTGFWAVYQGETNVSQCE